MDDKSAHVVSAMWLPRNDVHIRSSMCVYTEFLSLGACLYLYLPIQLVALTETKL